MLVILVLFFSSRRRHTRCALVTGVQTCALPISGKQPHSVKVRRLDTNEEITVSLTDAPAVKPGGKPRPEIACFAGVDRIDGQARTPNLKVGAGAVVQFENLKKAGNEYKASWMTLMSKNPAEAPVFVNVATTVREYKSGGDVNRYALFAHLPAATKVTSLDELKAVIARSEEHTSELQSLMRISYAVSCLQKKKHTTPRINN